MKLSTPEDRAILIVDREGEIGFAAGRPLDTGLREAALDLLRQMARKDARLSLLPDDGQGPTILLRMPIGEEVLALVMPADAREALVEFIGRVDFSFDILTHFLTNPFEAITVVDDKARLVYASPVHERFFGWDADQYAGLPVTEVIPNTRLHEVVKSGQPEIGRVQEMQDTRRIVNRFPIHRSGAIIGAIGQIMFKDPEQVHSLSRELADLKAEVAFYRKELDDLRRHASLLDDIVGESEPIRRLKSEIVKVAPLDMPVLLQGESGTGKELAARALHNLSNRSARPMVVLNSAALPANLVESELFGYETGAFTGANRKGQAGKFELANHTSLFLDEIGDMPGEMQAKFLRVLEDGVFERLGGHRSRQTDFRLISATNRNLEAMIADETFRSDLFFRIGAITLTLPPLRERADDIPMLVRTFLARIAQRYQLRVGAIEPEAQELLLRYRWPGNVRQLFHEVRKAAIFCDDGVIRVDQFQHLAGDHVAPAQTPIPGVGTIRDATADLEGRMIREAMQRAGGNKKRVAEELGMSRSHLYKRLDALGLL